MFKRPEELIVLILAILWVALTYFLAGSFITDATTVLWIVGLSLIWAIVCFFLWQRNLSRLIWPFFIGLLIACWWPFLDWFAIKDLPETAKTLATGTWYTSWTVKIILACIPVIVCYYWKWKRARKQRILDASHFQP